MQRYVRIILFKRKDFCNAFWQASITLLFLLIDGLGVSDLRDDPNYIRLYMNWTRFITTALIPITGKRINRIENILVFINL